MLGRTASHVVSPAFPLDFLIPNAIVRRAIFSHSSRDVNVNRKGGSRKAEIASCPLRHSSSSSPLTPGALLKQLDRENGVSTSQPLAAVTDTQADAMNKIIVQMHGAMQRRDMKKITELWSLVKGRKLLAVCGPPQYDVLQRVVKTQCQHQGQKLGDAEQGILIEMALLAAAAGATDGLRELMLLALHAEKPWRVVKLYDEYVQRLHEKGLILDTASNHAPESESESRSQSESESEADAVTSLDSPTSPLSPIRDEILLCAVAAYAQKDAFAEALPVFLQARTRIAPTTLEALHVRLPPNIKRKTEDYAHRLNAAALVARPEAYSKHLANLTRDSATSALERLYMTTIAGARDPDPWLALRPEELTGSRVLLLPDFFWSSFIKSFLACRRTNLAERLWDDMLQLGVVPDVSVWNALLDGYAKNRDLDAVLSTWQVMASQGVKRDPLSYRALIHAFYHEGRFEEGQRHFHAFEQAFVKPGTVEDSKVLAVYNTSIHDLLFGGRDKEASVLLQKMETHGPKPDIVTYNTFMRYHGRSGDLRAIASILQKLEAREIKPDVFTFSTLLSTLLKVRPDADHMLLNFMEKHGVTPDTTALTSIIEHQLRQANQENFKIAMDMLSKMERNEYKGAEPNAITYSAVLSAINRGSWLSKSVVEECNRRMWNTMQSRGIKPNRATYNILIRASLQNPEPEGLENGMMYYRHMLSERVHMGNDTWYIVLRGLMNREEWGLASEVVAQMRRLKANAITRPLRVLVSTISKRASTASGVGETYL